MKKLALVLIALTLVAARRRAVTPPEGPTFNREVVRILQQNCQSCHHEGDIAPFPLMTYRDAAEHAAEIKLMTKSRLMPPWKAAAGCGEFVGERTLAQRDIDTLAQWVDAGAPEGKAADLPKALEFDGGWALGRPDLTLSMPKSFTPPTDRDEYRCFSLPLDTPNDLDVAAIDFRPGDRGTVHHIVPYLDTKGVSAKLDKDGGGYTCFGGPGIANPSPLGGWSPGSRPTPLPDGVAVRIPKNSRVIMQVHYHPHHFEVLPDRTEIGLYLAKTPVTHQLQYMFVSNDDFVIPAGAANFHVEANETFPNNIDVFSVYPHMHLLGKRMNLEAVRPDGTKQCMIDIPDYDFDWQGAYLYRTPVSLAKGTRLHIEAIYDNPTDHDVRFGEASTDEMCLALIGYVLR